MYTLSCIAAHSASLLPSLVSADTGLSAGSFGVTIPFFGCSAVAFRFVTALVRAWPFAIMHACHLLGMVPVLDLLSVLSVECNC